MKWPSPALLAVILGTASTVSLAGFLILLPAAILSGQFRYWLRETGFVLYCTAFGAALIAACVRWG